MSSLDISSSTQVGALIERWDAQTVKNSSSFRESWRETLASQHTQSHMTAGEGITVSILILGSVSSSSCLVWTDEIVLTCIKTTSGIFVDRFVRPREKISRTVKIDIIEWRKNYKSTFGQLTTSIIGDYTNECNKTDWRNISHSWILRSSCL